MSKKQILSRKGALNSAMHLAQDAFAAIDASHITIASITDSSESGALSAAQIAGESSHLAVTLAVLMTQKPEIRELITKTMDLYIHILSDPDFPTIATETIDKTHDPQ